MGMGTAAAYADVITVKSIIKFCPKEYKALADEIDKVESWEEIAQGYGFGQDSDNENMDKAFHALQDAFYKKTGLDLNVAYHDRSTDGDRYDSDLVDGVYWCVEGAWQLSPAGKKMRKYFTRELFTTFG